MHLITSLFLAALLTQTAPTRPNPPAAPPSPPGAVPTPPAATPATPAITQAAPPVSNEYINWTKGTILDATMRIGIYSNAVLKPGNPLLFPVVASSGSSIVDLESIRATITVNGSTVDQGGGVDILNPESQCGSNMIQAPAPTFALQQAAQGNRIQMGFEIQQTVACWSSSVDEQAMATIPWPAAWPDALADMLKPQPLIESDDPIFAAALQGLTNGTLRQVAPWIAAKEIVKYCCNAIKADTTVMLYGPDRVLRGLDVNGALAAAQAEAGTACDLTCVCVAMLRAAGIPARPVIGLGRNDRNKNELLIWGEFYLPKAGWIPFDAKALQSKGVRSWTTDRSWNAFGNLSRLNKQVPLAHAFAPLDLGTVYDAWSIWGWSRLQGATTIPVRINSGNQPSSINYSLINRGKYPE